MEVQVTLTGDVNAMARALSAIEGGHSDKPAGKRGRPAKVKAVDEEEEAEVEETEEETEEETDDEFSEEEPEEKPAKKTKKAISKTELISACKDNRERALKILKKFKAESVHDVPAEKYGEFMKLLKA